MMSGELCRTYVEGLGSYDEMCHRGGGVRGHWEHMIRSLEGLGPHALRERSEETRRLLRESGVSYNVYDDPKGMNRPWELDPVPLLLPSEEWSELEVSLIQRAELLNLILADLYGPRTLIRKGLIPPELIFAHSGFLRACDGVRVPGNHQLVLYAADLARGPDGHFVVMGDRTQAPSGAGYALENRTVMTRVLPSLFRDAQVHRLALFFRTQRATLASLAPPGCEDPRIVLLTPGPRNETYFEHSYLANYLGYSLVQGSDLTVRNGRVWMKSLGGLGQVDVILRRVDDNFCDPVELREDSQLGVPGLLEAARQGRVTVVNPLGSSVLENPALAAYLPALSQHLLGQPLRLPSVPTWWCGNAKSRQHVLANLRRMAIKTISRGDAATTLFGEEMSTEQLAELRGRINARPYLYCAQEAMVLSSAPALLEDRLAPRPVLLRAFLTARDDAYIVMPGGLTRIGTEEHQQVVSSQRGAVSKDTWVLASEPEQQVSLWLQTKQQPPQFDLDGALPSRAAENLYWIGRYAERAEATIRLLRGVLSNLNEVVEFGDKNHSRTLACLLRATTTLTMTAPGFVGEGAEERLDAPEPELLSLILDGQRMGSLMFNLQTMVNNAYNVRDRISADTWRVINDIEEELHKLRNTPPLTLADAQDELDALVTALSAFSGLVMESMTREHGWIFLDAGRRLERAQLTGALLRGTLANEQEQTVEYQIMEAVLVATESRITYRRRYRSQMQVKTVLDLLLLDKTNPRGMLYQLLRLQENIDRLPGERSQYDLTPEQRLILEAVTLLQLSETNRLAQVGEGEMREGLDQLLVRSSHLLESVANVLSSRFFTHMPALHQIAPTVRRT